MRGRRFIWAFIAAAVLVAGCTIEPNLHVRRAIKVIVKVLWKAEVYPDGVKPTGMSLYLFRDGVFYKHHVTADVDSCTIQLEPGRYKMYVMSQSPDEFGQMTFSNLSNFDSVKVSLLETRSRWYTRSSNEVLSANPEMMVAGVSEEFEISGEMIEKMLEDLKNANSNGEADVVRYYTVRVPVNPVPVVSQYWVTIYSENADLLRSVRASTTGMARSFYLTQDKTGDDECVQIITDWTLKIDDPISRVGHLDGKVTTFGFPRGELPGPDRDPELNITTLLSDNSTTDSYVFMVGNGITLEKPPEGYRHLYRLVLGSVEAPVMHPPDVRPVEEQSVFDAMVEDWKDGGEVDIDM